LIYLLAATAILALAIWGSNGGRPRRYSNWRSASGLGAIGALAAGGFLIMRGAWILGLALGALGVWLALAARWPRRPASVAAPHAESMSLGEARTILGVGPEASAADIREAYARLMRRAHPDHGGTSGLAAQVNAARDRLSRP
jgi:hypothetical protein